MQTDLYFSAPTLLGYCIAILFYFGVPTAAFFGLKKHSAVYIFPIIVGTVVYLLFTRLNDIFGALFFSTAREMQFVIAAETVCYWEELGRWLAMRTPLTGIRAAGAAVSYGIGHGGTEAVLRGIGKCNILAIGLRLNREGISSFTAGLDPERAARITEKLREYAAHHLLLNILDSLVSASNFGVHIALSLLIYRGVRTEQNRKMLIAAILLHLLVNLCGWLASFGNSMILRDSVGIAAGTFVIWLAMKLADGRELLDEILYPTETEETA